MPYATIGGKVAAESVYVNVKFSKTDPQGYGRLVAHQRHNEGAQFIVAEIESFAASTRDLWGVKEEGGVLVWPDRSDVTADKVAGEMKVVAKTLGCDSKEVSAHSLRYGGVLLSVSFGLPQYLIEYFGGWKKGSKTMPLYARPNSKSLGLVSTCFGRLKIKGEIDERFNELGLA